MNKLIKAFINQNPNYLIDALMHGQFKGNPEAVIFDELLHAIAEGKFNSKKFVRYNLKHLIKELNRSGHR